MPEEQTQYLVNLHQSAQERREKYWLARSAGASPGWARALRDWRLPTLESFLGLLPNNGDTALVGQSLVTAGMMTLRQRYHARKKTLCSQNLSPLPTKAD